MKRLLAVLTLGMTLSACAGPPPEPPAPPPLDPTGSYSINIDAEGMQLGGSLVIREAANGGYRGSIDTDMGGAALSDIVVDGNAVTFFVPDAGVLFTVVFEGDDFTGSFDGDMGAGSIRGVKRQGG